MDKSERASMPTWLRAALAGTGLALAAVGFSVITDGSSAQAADDSTLLGVVSGLGDTVEGATGAVDGLLGQDLVSQTVAPVTTAVDQIASSTVSSVPIVGDELAGVTDGLTAEVVTPVAQTADSLLGTTGQVVGQTGAVVGGDIVGGVVGGVLDDVVDGVLVPTVDAVAPIPLSDTTLLRSAPAQPTASAVSRFGSADTSISAVSGGGSSSTALIESRPDLTAGSPAEPGERGLATPQALGTAGSAAGSAPAPVNGDLTTSGAFTLDLSLRGPGADSALPTSVTYDTDSSPD